MWDYMEAFNRMVEEETTAWKRLGVERLTQFVIDPSGSLKAFVACHLHNPSFYVADPTSQRTDDETNCCIKQLILAGFSSEQCLLYNHLLRREALDGFEYYPPEILQIHETFTFNLRKHMSAVVDICWDRCVRERMKCFNLIPLKLWGCYKDVELWLEFDNACNNES